MPTSTIPDFINDVRKIPQGLVLIVGPEKSGKTNTMMLLQSAVSKRQYGKYFNFCNEYPKQISCIRPFEAYKPVVDVEDETTEAEEQFENKQVANWLRRAKSMVFSPGTDAVFIDNIDTQPISLVPLAINAAFNGTLVVASVKAKNAEAAVVKLRETAEAATMHGSPITSVLKAIIVQNSVLDPDTGDTRIDAEVVPVDDDFRDDIASYD